MRRRLNASNNDDITFAIKKKITVIKFCSLWQEKQVSLKCPANIAAVKRRNLDACRQRVPR